MQELFGKKCSCCGGNLDRFVQPVILGILARGPQTGYAVLMQMSRYATFAGVSPDPTGIYRYLKQMKERGLLAQDEAALPPEAAPPYALTPAGRACLENWLGTLRAYSARIDALCRQLEADSAPAAP